MSAQLHAVPDDDGELEAMIARALRLMVAASDRGDFERRNSWCEIHARLIKERSPEQVKRMEKRMGL